MRHRNPLRMLIAIMLVAMMRDVLLQWAAFYRYPYLCLADGSHIKHGERAWQQALRSPKRALLAYQRIRYWEALTNERTA